MPYPLILRTFTTYCSPFSLQSQNKSHANLIFLSTSITLEMNHLVLLQVNQHMNKNRTTIIY